MGLTTHNKRRREMEEAGQGGQLTQAQAHYDAAKRRLNDLVDATAVAEAHLEAMAKALEAAQPKAPKKEKKAPAKKGK